VRETLRQPGRHRRRGGAIGALFLITLLITLLLTACSRGEVATPAPSVAPGPNTSATTGLPAPPPTATLPPALPTGTAARPGTPATPGLFGPATRPVTASATPVGTPGGGRRQTATTGPIVPIGEHPAGWRVYAGALPFTIAYPPDWSAEEDATRGLLYLYGPDPARTVFLVIASGTPEAAPIIDVLRDRWFQARTAPCARFAVASTGQERHSGLDFATVGTTCDLPGGLAYSLTGIGLLGNVPWIYELDAPYGDFAGVRSAAFDPILATWQINR
jgi:hypothetical protein